MTTVTAFLRAGAVSETSSQSSRLSQGAAPDVSHPHRNPAKRLRWGEEGQGSGVRDGHKAVPNGADFDPTRCRVPFSAKYTLRVKGRPCWGRQPHTEPQRGVSEATAVAGGKAPAPPRRAHGTFAPTGRKCHSGLLHFPQEVPSPNPRPFSTTKHLKWEDFCLWREATALTAPTQEI